MSRGRLPFWEEVNQEQRREYRKAVEYFLNDKLEVTEVWDKKEQAYKLKRLWIKRDTFSSIARGVSAVIFFFIFGRILLYIFLSVIEYPDLQPMRDSDVIIECLVTPVIGIVFGFISTLKSPHDLTQQELDEYVRKYREVTEGIR